MRVRVSLGVVAILSWVGGAPARPLPTEAHPNIATFSIAACDTAAGLWGVAVASKFFAVGSVVPWTRAEVGAVATQAQGNTSFGPRGLDLMERGVTAEEALEILLRDDTLRTRRQVGAVDAAGRSATYTGTECMAWAGGRTGPGYAAQGNILTGPEVVDAIARAFEETPGFLGDRLMAALEAGDKAGGDSRGRQSAALRIAKKGGGYGGLNDVFCDIRVDDHRDPIVELRRVYDVWRPTSLITEGYELVEKGRYQDAIVLGERAADLDPDSGQPFYHLACYHSRAGDAEKAMHYLAWAVKLDPKLRESALQDPDLTPLQARSDWKTLIVTTE